jgi:branched-chain amino acid transport system ATP-binding protein
VDDRLAYVLDVFPRLRERLKQEAGVLSGGEQQMVALGRALMGRPRLLLVDEPSIGLAPVAIDGVMAALTRLRQEGTCSILLVEQRVHEALEFAPTVHVLSRGNVRMKARSSDLANQSRELELAYFGVED